MSSLAEKFPEELARARELLAVYQSLGAIGYFGATMIEQAIARADKAAASGDTVAMVRSYAELKELE